MPINVISGLFQRVWKFVDQFGPGDEITRQNLDDALDDFVPAINDALAAKAAAELAASQAAAFALQASTAGATAGAAAGAEAADAAAAFQVAAAAAFAQQADQHRQDALDAATGNITVSAVDDGTRTSGTYTPTRVGGFYRRIINGGAFTLAAPTAAGDYQLFIQVTNNASAGTVTLTGFSKAVGDALTTTNGDDFLLVITKINGFILCERKALQ